MVGNDAGTVLIMNLGKGAESESGAVNRGLRQWVKETVQIAMMI